MAILNIVISGPSGSGKSRISDAIAPVVSGVLKQLPKVTSVIISETNKCVTPLLLNGSGAGDVLSKTDNCPPHIDWNQMGELGLIERINRQVLHPLGLAISRFPDSGLSGWVLVADDGEWEYNESLSTTDKLNDEQIRSLAFKMAYGEK